MASSRFFIYLQVLNIDKIDRNTFNLNLNSFRIAIFKRQTTQRRHQIDSIRRIPKLDDGILLEKVAGVDIYRTKAKFG
jgi:hypothetical protein